VVSSSIPKYDFIDSSHISWLTESQVVAPEKFRRFLSYVVGWCVLVGEISTSSSCALNSAEIVTALVEIMHPDVDWKVTNFLWTCHGHIINGPSLI
jgi:choline transport protein